MPAPALDKTWQFVYGGSNPSINIPMYSTGAILGNLQALLWRIKEILKGFGSAPWTVEYSCNSTVAGTPGDGIDRWTTSTNLVWNNAGSAHSWIVLKQTGIGSNFQVCFDLSSTNNSFFTVAVSSSAGFTGGTTTARPTATDEFLVRNNANWINNDASSYSLNVIQSTDGQCTRIWANVGYTNTGDAFQATIWMFDKARNPIPEWTVPALCLIQGGDFPAWANLLNAHNFSARVGAVNVLCSLQQQGFSAAIRFPWASQSIYGDLTGATPGYGVVFPVFRPLIIARTSGARGPLGTLFDCWYAPSDDSNRWGRLGTTYPRSATARQWVALRAFMWPWKGDSTQHIVA